jgi:hypothetical protein
MATLAQQYWQEGFREGLEIVRQKRTKAMAVRALRMHMPIDVIVFAMGLSEEEVLALQASLNEAQT